MASGDCVPWPTGVKPLDAAAEPVATEEEPTWDGSTKATVAGPAVDAVVAESAATGCDSCLVITSAGGAATGSFCASGEGIVAGEMANWSTGSSRNAAARAGFVLTTEEASSLAKSESLRTLAAIALIAWPPGGTVPITSARAVAGRALPGSVPNVERGSDPRAEVSAKVRRLASEAATVALG